MPKNRRLDLWRGLNEAIYAEIRQAEKHLLPPAPKYRRAIFLSCSATKQLNPESMPAIERYDGPLWRTLRAASPAAHGVKVFALSALHGLIEAETEIRHYNVRLTPERAERFIAGGISTRWPRPDRATKPDSCGTNAAGAIACLAGYGSTPVLDIALVGGGLYVDVMRAWTAEMQRESLVADHAQIAVINAPIGYMRQQLRAWIERAPNAALKAAA